MTTTAGKAELVARVVDLYGQGYSKPDIARHLGCSPSSVHGYLRGEGAATRKKRGTAAGLPPLGPSPHEIYEARINELRRSAADDHDFRWPDGHPGDRGQPRPALGEWFGLRDGVRPPTGLWPEVAVWRLVLDIHAEGSVWDAEVEERACRFRWTAWWGETILDRGFSTTLQGARKKAEGELRAALSDTADADPWLRREMQGALAALDGAGEVGL